MPYFTNFYQNLEYIYPIFIIVGLIKGVVTIFRGVSVGTPERHQRNDQDLVLDLMQLVSLLVLFMQALFYVHLQKGCFFTILFGWIPDTIL